MSNYFDAQFRGHCGEPVVLIVHDKSEIGMKIGGRICDTEYFPMVFQTGESLLEKINDDPTLINSAVAIMIHKDLGQHRQSIGSIDLVKQLREFPGGKDIRTGIISGEFADLGVSETARKVIGADFGYDPTGIERELPEWVVKMIDLGKLSTEEIQQCRHKETVVNRTQAELRIQQFRNRPSNREILN